MFSFFFLQDPFTPGLPSLSKSRCMYFAAGTRTVQARQPAKAFSFLFRDALWKEAIKISSSFFFKFIRIISTDDSEILLRRALFISE